MPWRGGAGCVVVSAPYGHAGNQRQYKCHHSDTRVMQISQGRIQIKLHGAPATGVIEPIGTEHPFTHRFWFVPHSFLANEAMRDELMGLLAMRALLMVQLHGLLFNGFQAGVVDLHDGASMEKSAYLAPFSFYGKIRLGELAL